MIREHLKTAGFIVILPFWIIAGLIVWAIWGMEEVPVPEDCHCEDCD